MTINQIMCVGNANKTLTDKESHYNKNIRG